MKIKSKYFPLIQLLVIAGLVVLFTVPLFLNKSLMRSIVSISDSHAATLSGSFTCSTVTVSGLDPITSNELGDYSLWIIGPGVSEGQTTLYKNGSTTTNLNFRRLSGGMLRPGQDYAIYLRLSAARGNTFLGQTHAVYPSSCPVSKPILSNVINFGINIDCSAIQATSLTPNKLYTLTVYGTNNFYRADITTGPMGVATDIFPNSQWPSAYLIPGQTAYFAVNDASNYDNVYGVSAVTVPQTCSTPAAPSNMKAVFDAAWKGMVLTWNDNSNNEQRFEFQHILTNGTTYSVFTQPNVTTAIDNDYNVSTCAMAHGVRFQVRAVIDTLISGAKYYSSWSPQFTFSCPPPADPTNVTAVLSGSGVLVRWQDNATNEVNYWVGRSDIARPYGGVADYLPPNTTSYQDNSISCPAVNGKSYKVNASNAAGYSAIVYSPVINCPVTATPVPTPLATPIPTASPSISIIPPYSDTRVKRVEPTSNYGSAIEIRAEKDSSGNYYESYLQFNITSIPSTVTITGAKLKLYSTGNSTDGPKLYLTSNTYKGTSTIWTELGLNWNNKPSLSGSYLSDKGSVSESTWVDYDITNTIKSGRNKLYSFGLIPDSTNGVRFASKENGNSTLNPYISISY
jgi:hypothetical protein